MKVSWVGSALRQHFVQKKNPRVRNNDDREARGPRERGGKCSERW